jgi:acyl-CoA hydrolase
LLESEGKMTAEQISHHLQMQNMDIVRFVTPVCVGDILEFRAQITFVDIKNNKVRVRVVCETVSPTTGKSLTPDENTSNVFNLTYQVTKIKLKQVLPKTYKQSLLYLQGMRVMNN